MGNKKVIAVLLAPLFLAFLLGLAWNFNHSREMVPTSAIPGDEDVVVRRGPTCGKTAITCNVDWGEEEIPKIFLCVHAQRRSNLQTKRKAPLETNSVDTLTLNF